MKNFLKIQNSGKKMVQSDHMLESLIESILDVIESNYSDPLGSKKLKQAIVNSWAKRQRAARESKRLDREASKHIEGSKEHRDILSKRDSERKEAVKHHDEYTNLQKQHKALHGHHYDVESHYD